MSVKLVRKGEDVFVGNLSCVLSTGNLFIGDIFVNPDADGSQFGDMAGCLCIPIGEHVTGEQAVDDANWSADYGVGAGETILHVDILTLQMGQNLLAQLVEVDLLERAVYLSPPDVFFRRGFAHDDLIVRRSSGVLPRSDDQRPKVRDVSFVAFDGVFVQFSSAQIPVRAFEVFDTVIFQTIRTGIPT